SATAKLVVNATCFVALGPEDMQAANASHLIMLFVSLLLVAIEDFVPLIGGHDVLVARVVPECAFAVFLRTLDFALSGAQRLCDALLHALLLGHEFRIAAKQNVRTASCHVGGYCDHTFAPGLGDDFCFTLVIFGIEHYVFDALLFKQFGEALGF